jgi:hypothetical protein
MKSRLSLKSSVKAALCSLIITLFLSSFGCSSSTKPTFQKENIEQAITDICRKEYNIKVKVTLLGSTLWIYFPTEDIVERTDKPEKSTSIFLTELTQIEPLGNNFKIDYLIKAIPPKEETQEYKSNKKVGEKINKIWSVLRRVVFSTDRVNQKEPQFYCVVSADIKNGFEIEELAYYLDLKKFSYGLMSVTEYQHRSIQEIKINQAIIGDEEGTHLILKDITMDDFIAAQIKYRMKLRFQKPEATKNMDIDKEVLKIAVYTIKAYNYRNFEELEINNLFIKNKVILNKTAVLSTTTN